MNSEQIKHLVFSELLACKQPSSSECLLRNSQDNNKRQNREDIQMSQLFFVYLEWIES